VSKLRSRKDDSWGKRIGIPVHLQVIQPRGRFLHTLVLFAYLLINCNVDITAISIFETGVKNYKSYSYQMSQMGNHVSGPFIRGLVTEKCTGDLISVWGGRREL